MSSISMKEIENLMQAKTDEMVFLDVRETYEFENGHVEGAVNLPLSGIAEGTLPADKDATYYVICRSGGRSALGAQLLGASGYKAINVDGGMLAYAGPIAK